MVDYMRLTSSEHPSGQSTLMAMFIDDYAGTQKLPTGAAQEPRFLDASQQA
jgi:hypothetical protein